MCIRDRERERKGKNGKIIKVAGCSPIREGVLLIRPDTTLADVRKFGEECLSLIHIYPGTGGHEMDGTQRLQSYETLH